MLNREHDARLRSGIGTWNLWRASERVTPQLARANLQGLDLRHADLSEADLSRANLAGAQLFRADLARANLSEANLTGAILHEACMVAADLSGASLQGAVLSEADLSDANAFRADLRGANCRAAHFQGTFLRGATLVRAVLSGAQLMRSDLLGADLTRADLFEADLAAAHLSGASLSEANLSDADLSGCLLKEANLTGANLSRARLVDATLRRSNLSNARLVDCDCRNADFRGSKVFGASVWNATLDGARQENLIITPPDEPSITLDSLEVAQFVYLLLNNGKIRHVIETIATKTVLILGRFSPERKAVLDQLREELRNRDYLPILFDFDRPSSRSFTETVSTLAHMARFIIADITEPRSIPQELQRLIPALPSVPVQLVVQSGFDEWGMLADFFDYPSVLKPYRYADKDELRANLSARVISPAERLAEAISRRRNAALGVPSQMDLG
jgi:uncharacterized protein YjbI with pentapeptide repeats